MARFDFKCTHCGFIRPDVPLSNWQDASAGHREFCECGREMTKLPAAPNFTVTGYNAKNGYTAP